MGSRWLSRRFNKDGGTRTRPVRRVGEVDTGERVNFAFYGVRPQA